MITLAPIRSQVAPKGQLKENSTHTKQAKALHIFNKKEFEKSALEEKVVYVVVSKKVMDVLETSVNGIPSDVRHILKDFQT